MNFAVRALARDPLYVGLGILALAIGLAAAILATLYIRDELGFDRFIPGHDRIAVVVTDLTAPGRARMTMDYSPGGLVRMLKAEVPGVAEVSRLAFDDVSVGRGAFQAREQAAWVDPNFFDLLRLPGLTGDARQAVRLPDGAVITQSVASRYFGSSRALGSTIQIDGSHVFRVRAVIKDLPANSHLAGFRLFLSGRSTASVLKAPGGGFLNAVVDPRPFQHVRFIRERTYVRLAEGFSREGLEQAMARLGRVHARQMALQPTSVVRFSLVPLDRLHTYPFRGINLGPSDVHTDLASLLDLGVLGGLILLLAVTNFVNLATARGAGRAREVGVRKAAGASRTDLVRQFLGETFVQAAIATVLAVSIVELSLPVLNAFLMKDLRFEYWRQPAIAASLLVAMVVVTLLAGAYPAFVLSSFRPAQAIRAGGALGGGSAAVRNGLVAFQFSVLVVLLLGTAVVGLQTRFSMTEGLRLDTDGVLVVQAAPPCQDAFEDEVRRLPGVRSAGCASKGMLGMDDANPIVTDAGLGVDGRSATVALGLADFGTFETLGVRPLAGRLFQLSHRELDQFPTFDKGPVPGSTILNESAVRALGFAHAADIVGRTLRVPRSGPKAGADAWTVIGVVPDFTLDVRSAAVKPTAYTVRPDYPFEQVLAVRIDGRRMPETLRAIDRLWNATGHLGAPRRQFLDDYVQRLYLVTTRQGVLVSGLCLIATVLACAGLLALSSYTAQRRTKEIGIRKAMGATARDIVRILLLQFSRPIGLGILVGTPIAYVAARHWLAGFTYHIALEPWLFAATALIALAIGLGAGLFHALAVAHARPVDALRYE